MHQDLALKMLAGKAELNNKNKIEKIKMDKMIKIILEIGKREWLNNCDFLEE